MKGYKMQKKILFVCLGNICRSVMAEFIMKDKTKRYGAENAFEIASAATSDEEYGNPIYPPAQRILREHDVYFDPKKTSRQLTREDYAYYDYIIGMDESNRRNILRITQGDPEHKVSLLLEHTENPHAVADPWLTRDFQTAWDDIENGCEALCRKFGLK